MQEQWYYSRQNETHGPFSREQITQMARSGQLLPSDELWLEGHSARPVSEYKGLLAPAPTEAFSNPLPKAQSPKPATRAAPPIKPRVQRSTFVVGLVVITLVVWGIWRLNSFFATSGVPNWAAVKVACEAAVRNDLKAPSTAQFPDTLEAQKSIVIKDDTATWVSWVDAENSFGAMIRTGFECIYQDGVAVAFVD